MRAELVMIGTELTIDTNASILARELAKLGVDLFYKSTVGDNWLRVIEVLSRALSRADLVITSGGIGPTLDDLTREAVAATTNRPLQLDEEALKTIQGYFSQRNRIMTDNNRKQAYLPEGAQVIANHWGTAPGILLEVDNKTIICLPGVPRELKGMLETEVIPYLAKRNKQQTLLSRTLKFTGIGESQLVEQIENQLVTQSNPTIAPYASIGEVRLRITAKATTPELAEELIKPVENQLISELFEYYYGADDQTLEMVIGAKLAARQEMLAIAESCTGGLISDRVTNVSGSSVYFNRGLIVYSNQAKVELLGVEPQLLAKYGAVSAEVALAMAKGVCERSGTDWGLSVTGIAGPDGGTPEKPVGLVHMAVAYKGNTKAQVHYFKGSREEIKFSASQAALNLLRQELNSNS